ncbi:hypothetical protein PENSUB_12997 [Penicillium subrubescens]|uniref:Uncharacterized protein n=1 Tax=Penicillium subrubescens TaxID=1316194 RepID=A0A1Q5SUF2_9EURO|nr:hypothetical protein PENSUB_12997 [Penicillium subrubescens]
MTPSMKKNEEKKMRDYVRFIKQRISGRWVLMNGQVLQGTFTRFLVAVESFIPASVD